MLPTIPGSVIRADLEEQGKVARRVLLLTCYEPNPWRSHQDVRDRAYWSDTDLGNVEVIHDEGAMPWG